MDSPETDATTIFWQIHEGCAVSIGFQHITSTMMYSQTFNMEDISIKRVQSCDFSFYSVKFHYIYLPKTFFLFQANDIFCATSVLPVTIDHWYCAILYLSCFCSCSTFCHQCLLCNGLVTDWTQLMIGKQYTHSGYKKALSCKSLSLVTSLYCSTDNRIHYNTARSCILASIGVYILLYCHVWPLWAFVCNLNITTDP